MSKAKPSRKPGTHFRRFAPEDRSRQLAEATLRCIRKKGTAGVSARQIAAEAGVSQGLITHHFGEVSALSAYAFELMWGGIFQAITAAIDAAPNNPRARLDACIDASFSPAIFDQDVLAIWVVFWGLILHSAKMSAAQRGEYSTYVRNIEQLLADLASAEGFSIRDTRLAAIAFTALLDGLWLAWCLNPSVFSPAEGMNVCRQWVEGLRRGAHA